MDEMVNFVKIDNFAVCVNNVAAIYPYNVKGIAPSAYETVIAFVGDTEKCIVVDVPFDEVMDKICRLSTVNTIESKWEIV